jgi:hypothetical protein
MVIRLPGSGEDIICARVEADLLPLIPLILKAMKDWGPVSVKISSIAGSPDGERSKRVTITYDAGIFEQSETTFSTKS